MLQTEIQHFIRKGVCEQLFIFIPVKPLVQLIKNIFIRKIHLSVISRGGVFMLRLAVKIYLCLHSADLEPFVKVLILSARKPPL